ncbi:hypothetical protein Hypma_006364 [Hypsizygus marmoreus]|uniref:Uncharacterized protein n=1 Tax=Hypsizygus marmoreus TaxID=39966 RepID=A0A369JUA4_HYPMA|nr:hypothetical protein Hypma_006364 [Hypsizygus marmoreus]
MTEVFDLAHVFNHISLEPPNRDLTVEGEDLSPEPFKSQPPPQILNLITPQLLTQDGTLFDALFDIPHPVFCPLVFQRLEFAQAEYINALDIRDTLWVEEMLVEMELRRQQGGPTLASRGRHIGQDSLLRIRILIQRACLALSYIECSCIRWGLSVDFNGLRKTRFSIYPRTHPRNLLEPYLRKSGPNYPVFSDYEDQSLEELIMGFGDNW